MTSPRNPSSTDKAQSVELTAPRSFLRALVADDFTPSLEHTLVRPDDQVRLRFELINGEIDRTSGEIVKLEGEEPIYYQIWFGPQHGVEPALGSGTTPTGDPLDSRIAGESRIVVEIPEGTEFTVGTLLNLAAYTLQLDERALGEADGTNDREPTAAVTAVEVPTSLVLSPTPDETFVSNPEPITHGDITELWRARLAGNGPAEPPAGAPAVRAIWNRPEDPDFDRPVKSGDRVDLVTLTTEGDATPIPIHRLWLSSQGAFMEADGVWTNGDLAAYRHRVVTGRDLHVEVVARGYLTPFGHPASITTLTERTFREDDDGVPTASLLSEEYIAITTPAIEVDAPYIPNHGRGIPFTHVSASDPGSGPIGRRHVTLPNGSSIRQRKAAIVTRDGDDLHMEFTATDQNGQGGISFELPVVFVAESEAYQPEAKVDRKRTVLQKLKKWYAQDENIDFSTAELKGQAVAWAEPPADPEQGSAGSVQTTNRIRFRLDRPDTDATDPETIAADLEAALRPAFYPAVQQAWIVNLSATTVMGGQPPETEVTVAQRYLDHGLEAANVDLGYLDLEDSLEITPTTDATGMISSGLQVDTLGQRLGAGIDLSLGEWDPGKALSGAPKLLGNLALDLLIDKIEDLSDLSGLPKMEIELIPGESPTAPPQGVCVQFSWEPELKSFPKGAEKKTFIIAKDLDDQIPEAEGTFGDQQTHALLAIRNCTPGDTTFEASLERFALQVPPGIPVVAVLFRKLRFQDVNGHSTVETEIADWLFINQLGWLEPIKDFLLGSLGLGEPIFEGGIFVDFDLPIPGLTLGIVNVGGLQVGLGIDLPDSPDLSDSMPSSVDFTMSSREDPFTITVFGVGGSGSFELQVDASQIVYIEGSLAVTYELSVNVFIASASLSVALGVFVIYEVNEKTKEKEVILGAYATLSGSLSFIGIVKITGSVTVALIYKVNKKLLRGVAAVTGEVSSPFGKSSVTKDVEVEVDLGEDASGKSRKRLGVFAHARDLRETEAPSFQDRYEDETQWTEYCCAFAALGGCHA